MSRRSVATGLAMAMALAVAPAGAARADDQVSVVTLLVPSDHVIGLGRVVTWACGVYARPYTEGDVQTKTWVAVETKVMCAVKGGGHTRTFAGSAAATAVVRIVSPGPIEPCIYGEATFRNTATGATVVHTIGTPCTIVVEV